MSAVVYRTNPLEVLADSLNDTVIHARDSVMLNFEFDKYNLSPSGLAFMFDCFNAFIPSWERRYKEPEINIFTSFQSIDGVVMDIFAAQTRDIFGAYRVVKFDGDPSHQLTVQYSTSDLDECAALIEALKVCNEVGNSLLSVIYGISQHPEELNSQSLNSHFDMLTPGCLIVPDSEKIVDAFARNGWSLYSLLEKEGTEYILASSGPVSSLRVNSAYVFVPKPTDPYSKESIDAALEHARLTSQALRCLHSSFPPQSFVMVRTHESDVVLVDNHSKFRPLVLSSDSIACIRDHFSSYQPEKPINTSLFN